MENKRNLKIKAVLTPKSTGLDASRVGFPCFDLFFSPLLFSYIFPKSSETPDFDGSCAAEDLLLLNADTSAPAGFQSD